MSDAQGTEDGFAIGTIVQRKYRIDALLGEGAMGLVYRATHLHLDEPVAIKVLRRSLRAESIVERFQREARACLRVRSPHVVRVLDLDRPTDGPPFLVMELLDGEDAEALVSREGPLPIAEAVAIVREACIGVAAAHRAGLVHRDLKPANLFLARTDEGVVTKVLDFGISKWSGVSTSQTQGVFGSPSYMSPEQLVAAADVDARTDVWSLGATLFELLTGRLPFEADHLPALVYAIAHTKPPSPCELRPEIPRALEVEILRALESDRDARTPSAEAFAAALEPFAIEAPGDAVPRSSRPRISSPSFIDTQLAASAAPPRESQGRLTVALAAVAAAVAIGLFSFFARSRATTPVTAAPKAAIAEREPMAATDPPVPSPSASATTAPGAKQTAPSAKQTAPITKPAPAPRPPKAPAPRATAPSDPPPAPVEPTTSEPEPTGNPYDDED
jgi:serine/threonine-protein kinase